jgi:hypothetical protein
MLASFAQISPAIKIHRNRVLPVNGSVIVRKGQKVNENDVVAEASLPAHHILIDVVQAFGLADPKLAASYIKRAAGETLDHHDIIAETGGMFSRILRTPKPGKIITVRDGLVLIETEAKSISLKALYPGVITDILPDRGVVIETSGAVVQAAWANGLTGTGPLICKTDTRSDELVFSSLEVTARGAVIAGGTCSKPDILTQAALLPVAGLILGTMPAAMIDVAKAQPYPILVIDGFGNTGMDSSSWKLLFGLANEEVIVNGETTGGLVPGNPEVMVYAPVDDQNTASAKMFTSGQTVRIHAAPNVGQTGRIEKILPGTVTLPNGLKVAAASIIMDNNERKTIPVANLDVIGFTS